MTPRAPGALITALTTDGAGQALRFIFAPTFSELEPRGILEALGHAFFTLSLGMGAMITYGSYMSRKESVVRASILVVLLDTVIAIVATKTDWVEANEVPLKTAKAYAQSINAICVQTSAKEGTGIN